jgi:hypothetical protein
MKSLFMRQPTVRKQKPKGCKSLEVCMQKKKKKKLVAPTQSGGRDQEDQSSKPAEANSSPYPISKILNPKKG